MSIAAASQAGFNQGSPSAFGVYIKGMLEDARKKGLLQAQSQFQTEGAKELAAFKQDNATPGRFFQNTEGGLVDKTPEGGVFSGDVIKNPPSEGDDLGGLLAGILEQFKEKEDGENVDAITPDVAPKQTTTDDDMVEVQFSDGKIRKISKAQYLQLKGQQQ